MKVSSQVVDFSNNFLLLRKFRIEKNTVTPPTCDCDEPLNVTDQFLEFVISAKLHRKSSLNKPYSLEGFDHFHLEQAEL